MRFGKQQCVLESSSALQNAVVRLGKLQCVLERSSALGSNSALREAGARFGK